MRRSSQAREGTVKDLQIYYINWIPPERVMASLEKEIRGARTALASISVQYDLSLLVNEEKKLIKNLAKEYTTN